MASATALANDKSSLPPSRMVRWIDLKIRPGKASFIA